MTESRPWRVLREHLLLDRSPWLRVVEQDVVLPDGSTLTGFLLTEVRDYAMVFALTPEGHVPLVHQYKHGLRGAAYDLPAGYLDPREAPLFAHLLRIIAPPTAAPCRPTTPRPASPRRG